MKTKSKDDKLKYHREYMMTYREKHKERVRAQKNASTGRDAGCVYYELLLT
jgi:hypothetical protein